MVFPYLNEQLFQSIQSDFIQGIEAHAQMAPWKTFFMHPYQVIFRDIAKQPSLILPKRHGEGDDIDQDLGIHFPKIPFFQLGKQSLWRLMLPKRLGN